MAETKTSGAQPKSSGFNPVQFLREVSAEMKKVSWSTTVVVSITVFVVCALIWICDSFFARLFNLIVR